nr:hypothetical protein [Tanacetum cinerariifolium]
MNQNFYNSNSFDFDQFQPPPYPVVHQPPQETSTEILQARENLIEAIQVFLKKYDQIPFEEKCIALLLDGDDDDDDYDKESIISTNTDIFETPPSDAITTSPPVLPIEDPKVSLIIRNEELNTIPEKESDEFIKSSVEDLVPTPSESEDTSGNESVCILPSYDDFSPIDVPEEKAVTFSNLLFNLNDDLISSGDESLSDEDVPKDNVTIYSNPLFEIDDEYISSDVNPLIDEVLENIESTDSYDSNLDEPDLLVTPLFDANEDECFDSGGDVDKINDFEDGNYDSKGDILYLESLLSDDTTPNLPPEVFLDRDLRSLSDAPIDDLMSEDKIFNPGICVKKFSPTYGKIPTLHTRSPLLLEAVTPDTHLCHPGNPKTYDWMTGRVRDPRDEKDGFGIKG